MSVRAPLHNARRVLQALPVASTSACPLPPAPSAARRHFGHSVNPSTSARSQAGPRAKVQQRRAFHSSRPSQAKDPYKVLGVDPKATVGDIKKTYYQLAKKYHPDQNKEKGAKEKFVEIQTAYDTLSDEKKRAAYDTYGSASQDANFDPSGGSPFGAGGFGGFHDFSGAFGGGMGGRGTGDLFESLFGGMGGGARAGPQRPAKGDDLEANITIDFLEACSGTTRTITTHPVTDCGTCTGTGMKGGAKRQECKSCGGTGIKTFMIQSGFRMQSSCNVCGGAGSVIPKGKECGTCDGLGKVKEKKAQSVTIPAGVDDGLLLRMPGAGDLPLSGSGPAGDLLIRIGVRPSLDYRRQGTTLFYTAKIPVHVALLGGKTTVPTLEGNVDIKVKNGTQFGDQIVLSGRGVTSAMVREKKRGDLIVEYQLEIPRSLTVEQRGLIEAYADTVKSNGKSAYSSSKSPTGYSPSPSSSSPGPSSSSSSTSSSKTNSTGASGSGTTDSTTPSSASSEPDVKTDDEPASKKRKTEGSEGETKEKLEEDGEREGEEKKKVAAGV